MKNSTEKRFTEILDALKSRSHETSPHYCDRSQNSYYYDHRDSYSPYRSSQPSDRYYYSPHDSYSYSPSRSSSPSDQYPSNRSYSPGCYDNHSSSYDQRSYPPNRYDVRGHSPDRYEGHTFDRG